MRGPAFALTIAAAIISLAACQPDLAKQPKYRAYAPSDVWNDGTSARPRVEGTVARGALARAEAVDHPPPATDALLARGQERYGIYCVPCHGAAGDGNGLVVQRGFPEPPSYHSPRLRQSSGRHIFDVISNGYGAMYSYADRVEPTDRWAIVSYVRALQLARLRDDAEAPR